jgi:predicted permease
VRTATLVLPLFAVILLGYVLRKTGFLSAAAVGEFNKFIYYIALPVTIIIEMFNVQVKDATRLDLLIGYPLIVILTASVALLLTAKIGPARRGAFAQISYRGNLAYFGLPIVSMAIGPASLGYVAVIIGVGLIINTTLSIVLLTLNSQSARPVSFRGHILSIIRNPLIISVAVGLAASLGGLKLPPVMTQTLGLIGQTSLPVVLIVVGFSLSFNGMRRGLGLNLLGALLKLIIMPLIAVAVVTGIFGERGMARDVVVLMSAMPSAAIAQSFARQFGADEALTAASISLNNVLCMITVPIWILLLQGPLAG